MTDPEPPRPPGVPDLDVDLPSDPTPDRPPEVPPAEDDIPGGPAVEPTG